MNPDAAPAGADATWLYLIEMLGPTISTLLVGIIGFGGVILSVRASARARRHQHQHEIDAERRGLAAALMGEIASILFIVEAREYIERLEAAVKRGREDISAFQVYTFQAKQSYFEAFSANLVKIGLLNGGLAYKVVRFYTASKSILEDAQQLDEGLDPSAEAKLQRMEEMLALMVEARRLGTELVHDLAGISDQPIPEDLLARRND